MLSKTVLAEGPGFAVVDVRCTCGREGWSPPEQSTGYALVFVRSGCFRRMCDGVESLLDSTAAYFESPGHEQQVAHPHDGGDRCTAIELEADFLLRLFADEPTVTPHPVFTTAFEDLAHRRLLAAADEHEIEEHVIALVAAVVRRIAVPRPALGRTATTALRRRIVDAARECLAADPRLSLVALAQRLAISPHHLSRVFAAETGETLSRYRNRLRARIALERLADGEPSLARIAADLGFADHAHLTRVVRAEAGAPPSRLRAQLVR